VLIRCRYKTSKAAASHLAKNMSASFAPYDIRVNAIAPGLFQSELAQSTVAKGHSNTEKKPWEDGAFDKKNIPLGRIGRGKLTSSELCCDTNQGRGGNGRHDLVPLLEGGWLLQWNDPASRRWQAEYIAWLLDEVSAKMSQKRQSQSRISIIRKPNMIQA